MGTDTMPPALLRDRIVAGDAVAKSASDLGLPGRAVVYIEGGWCVSLIDRKSRFLRKDAVRFVALLTAARVQEPTLAGHIMVRTAPVCSQARAWLAARKIQVEQL